MESIRRNTLRLKSFCSNHLELNNLIHELELLEERLTNCMKSFELVLNCQKSWSQVYSPTNNLFESVGSELEVVGNLLQPAWQQWVQHVATHRRSLQQLRLLENELDLSRDKLAQLQRQQERSYSLNNPDKSNGGLTFKNILKRKSSTTQEEGQSITINRRKTLNYKEIKLLQMKSQVFEQSENVQLERSRVLIYGMSAIADACLFFSEQLAIAARAQQTLVNLLPINSQLSSDDFIATKQKMLNTVENARKQTKERISCCVCQCHRQQTTSPSPSSSLPQQQQLTPSAPPAYNEVVTSASLYPLDELQSLRLSCESTTAGNRRQSLPLNQQEHFHRNIHHFHQRRTSSVHWPLGKRR